jgi:hypothetical protein
MGGRRLYSELLAGKSTGRRFPSDSQQEYVMTLAATLTGVILGVALMALVIRRWS